MISYSQFSLVQNYPPPKKIEKPEPVRCGRVLSGNEKLLRLNWAREDINCKEVARLSGYGSYKSALKAAHKLGLPPRNHGYFRKTKLARMLAAK